MRSRRHGRDQGPDVGGSRALRTGAASAVHARTGSPERAHHPFRGTPRRRYQEILSRMRVSRASWTVRSVLAGTAGTAALTLAYAAERRLRRTVVGPLDYDDSLVPGQIVAGVMHLPHVTDREDRELGLLLRWSYGSAFGLWHGILRRRLREPWASVGFGA